MIFFGNETSGTEAAHEAKWRADSRVLATPSGRRCMIRCVRGKAGHQVPSLDSFQKIHVRAVRLGYIGQGATLQAMQERAGMMGEIEWEFWRRYEANPAFDVEAREQELRERLVALEQEAAAIRRALASDRVCPC
jgi:hypothetical protein